MTTCKTLVMLGLGLTGLTASGYAQSAEDPSAVSQLEFNYTSDVELIEQEQLNIWSTETLNATQVDQLRSVSSATDVEQATGGKDYCAPGLKLRYQFCDELEKRPLKAIQPKARALAEEDLAAGSPLNIERFTSDPSLTADQIGRGTASSLTAQSLGDQLLRGKGSPEEQMPDAGTNGLPPDVLSNYGGAPVITEGN